MTTENRKKNAKIFLCEKCDYNTSNKYDYNRHLSTVKHKNNEMTTETSTINKLQCKNCYKFFNDRAGLWRHNKKCSNENITNILDSEQKHQQLFEYLLKENSEFRQLMIDQNKQMLEQNKHMMEIAKNSGNNNNNNFNLNFFLNETCKNAMNIMDFVSQLQVGIKELEDTGRLGFAEGISKIFINGLKQIDVSDRPIHCSDSKREVVYIKDKNQWSKETEEKLILTNAIKQVAHKNMKQISEWTKTHPEFNDSTSKQNDKYLKIVCESMSGSSQEEANKNYNKIIKNIVKETIIDK
jgi:hypothetical protein